MKINLLVLSLILCIAIFVSGCSTETSRMEKQESGAAMERIDTSVIDEDEAMIEENSAVIERGFSGTILAGNTSFYLEFNQADYERALNDKKVILLNFYAEWCPSCIAEEPNAYETFNQLSNPNVAGFRVNYKDSKTDADELTLAKKFGITYQHTKVILDKKGERVVKSLESWDAERYLSELAKYG